ncbi:MAG: hypothetical protein JSU94_11915 [Phycisphaerales bacterium]|nr:MAG: hypothetical protein JSU94_11915 [Phycisphaerales bacterium]
MKAVTAQIEEKVDGLLIILDQDIRNLEENLQRLDELRGLVVKRDEEALVGLLEVIQRQSSGQSENESRRKRVCEELAAALGWPVGHVTLSRLEAVVTQDSRAGISGRREALKLLAERLKTEYVGTAMLLADCARFNSMLLRSVLDFGGAETLTYGPTGSAKRHGGTAFVNFQY